MNSIKLFVARVVVVCTGGFVAGLFLGLLEYLLGPSMIGSDAQKYVGIHGLWGNTISSILAGVLVSLLIFFPVYIVVHRSAQYKLWSLGICSGLFVLLLFSLLEFGVPYSQFVPFWVGESILFNVLIFRFGANKGLIG